MRPLMVELCAGTGTMAAAFRALEPGAHQMSAVVDLAVAVLESDAATSAHKELVAR